MNSKLIETMTNLNSVVNKTISSIEKKLINDHGYNVQATNLFALPGSITLIQFRFHDMMISFFGNMVEFNKMISDELYNAIYNKAVNDYTMMYQLKNNDRNLYSVLNSVFESLMCDFRKDIVRTIGTKSRLVEKLSLQMRNIPLFSNCDCAMEILKIIGDDLNSNNDIAEDIIATIRIYFDMLMESHHEKNTERTTFISHKNVSLKTKKLMHYHELKLDLKLSRLHVKHNCNPIVSNGTITSTIVKTQMPSSNIDNIDVGIKIMSKLFPKQMKEFKYKIEESILTS